MERQRMVLVEQNTLEKTYGEIKNDDGRFTDILVNRAKYLE
jgi:hypothetical protein